MSVQIKFLEKDALERLNEILRLEDREIEKLSLDQIDAKLYETLNQDFKILHSQHEKVWNAEYTPEDYQARERVAEAVFMRSILHRCLNGDEKVNSTTPLNRLGGNQNLGTLKTKLLSFDEYVELKQLLEDQHEGIFVMDEEGVLSVNPSAVTDYNNQDVSKINPFFKALQKAFTDEKDVKNLLKSAYFAVTAQTEHAEKISNTSSVLEAARKDLEGYSQEHDKLTSKVDLTNVAQEKVPKVLKSLSAIVDAVNKKRTATARQEKVASELENLESLQQKQNAIAKTVKSYPLDNDQKVELETKMASWSEASKEEAKSSDLFKKSFLRKPGPLAQQKDDIFKKGGLFDQVVALNQELTEHGTFAPEELEQSINQKTTENDKLNQQIKEANDVLKQNSDTVYSLRNILTGTSEADQQLTNVLQDISDSNFTSLLATIKECSDELSGDPTDITIPDSLPEESTVKAALTTASGVDHERLKFLKDFFRSEDFSTRNKAITAAQSNVKGLIQQITGKTVTDPKNFNREVKELKQKVEAIVSQGDALKPAEAVVSTPSPPKLS